NGKIPAQIVAWTPEAAETGEMDADVDNASQTPQSKRAKNIDWATRRERRSTRMASMDAQARIVVATEDLLYTEPCASD
ncbi:TPA: hypothetical protein N0F65_005104, partial [Lagenidium giganteum]